LFWFDASPGGDWLPNVSAVSELRSSMLDGYPAACARKPSPQGTAVTATPQPTEAEA
jgi:hypothetical protein